MKKKKLFFYSLASVSFVTLLVGMLWASGSHKHHDKKEKNKAKVHVKGTQKVCPIRKEKIDPKAYIDYQGQRVYFCCQMCDKKFLKKPDARFIEMEKRGERTDSIQKYCPVSGDLLEDRDVSARVPGRTIYFCCKKCVKTFNKNQKKYLGKITGKQPKHTEHHDGHKGHDHSGHHH